MEFANFKTVIEIGCHYQNTVLDMPECADAKIWLVDAVEEFIQRLPNQKNIHKICAAVTANFTGKKLMRGILPSTQKEKNLPEWSTTMGSLADIHHPTINRFNWDEFTTEFIVDCYSVKDFWYKFELPKDFDFISTDLEGIDYHVLKALFDNNISCKVLKFESKLMNDDQLTEIKKILIKKGFDGIITGNQTDYAGKAFNHWAYKGKIPSINFN